ncbi:MAG: DUF362 domain-containing protein [Candidatus Krumholzibacteria bacterium]|jgi:uncharacterized protein (DUF362 family)|nr:DUF362 domain-containing protein [Candidatus Krumholzibacteria bacterium]
MATRRTFIKVLGGGAALLMTPAEKLAGLSLPGEDPTTFAVVRGGDPAAAVRKAVDMLGGMGSFVKTGDVVFVKPNISWDRRPEQAATTNPAVVETVVAMVREAGASRIIVADNACNEARRTYKTSGIREAAERAGAEVPFMEKRKFRMIDLGGEVMKDWEVYTEAIEADKIINLPVAKHHGLSNVTLSMKNLMGLIGGRRDLLHQKLPECVVDLTAFFKPALTILDAVRLLRVNGPQGGTLGDVVRLDTIAASTDQVKIDAFGISLFEGAEFDTNPLSFPHVRIAQAKGLGSADFRGRGYAEIKL